MTLPCRKRLPVKVQRRHQRSWCLITVCAVASFACSSSTSVPDDSANPTPLVIGGAHTVSATSTQVRDPNSRLRYVVTITNRSSSTEEVKYSGCWAYIRLYKTAGRDGLPSYDSANPRPACPLPANHATVAPGDLAQIVGYYELASVLATGVVPAHYYVSLVVAPDGVTTSLAAGEIDLQP